MKRHPVNVAIDVANLVKLITPYVVQTTMNASGVFVKAGDYKNRQAATVNITRHRPDNNSMIKDKLLAIKITYLIIKNLRNRKHDL